MELVHLIRQALAERPGVVWARCLGFGLGAVTEFDGVRSVNTSDWDTYIQASGDFTKITERVERLGAAEC